MPSALTVFRLMAGPMRSGLMSQLGQTRKWAPSVTKSALPLLADMPSADAKVRKVPSTDSRLRRCRFLFGSFGHPNGEHDHGNEGGGT
jgi:hypothetical protein